MFSAIDILDKELDNDQFKTECVVECICMDIENAMETGYTTEAEGSGFFASIVEKIKKIVSTIINSIKNAILKLADHIRKEKLEAKYKELSERAKYIEKTYGQVLKQNDEWKEYISDKSIWWFDFSTSLKSHKTIGDRAIAAFKNLANKRKGGKKITAGEIRDIRDKVFDEGIKCKKSCKEEVRISSLSTLVSIVSHAGAIGGLAAVITKAVSGGNAGAAFVAGTVVSAFGDITIALAEGAKGVTRVEVEPITKAYGAADSEMKEQLALLSQGMSTISSTIAQSETQSYREAIKSLSSALREVEQMLNTAERIGKSALEHRNLGDRLANEREDAKRDKEVESLKNEISTLKSQQKQNQEKQ